MPSAFPFWTLLSFPALVLAIAVFPMTIPHRWEKRGFQIAVVALCTLPVVVFELASSRGPQVWEGLRGYLAFVVTLGALFTTSSGIHLRGDIEATPRNNLLFLLAGACLASIIGTTGASMLLIRPLLKTNRQREHRAHLVPLLHFDSSQRGWPAHASRRPAPARRIHRGGSLLLDSAPLSDLAFVRWDLPSCILRG